MLKYTTINNNIKLLGNNLTKISIWLNNGLKLRADYGLRVGDGGPERLVATSPGDRILFFE